MKNYNVKIQVIKENLISVPAFSKKDAIERVEEFVKNSDIKKLDIENITNDYILLDLVNKNILTDNSKIIYLSD